MGLGKSKTGGMPNKEENEETREERQKKQGRRIEGWVEPVGS